MSDSLRKVLVAAVKTNPDWISLLANVSSNIHVYLNSKSESGDAVNWSGFYLRRPVDGLEPSQYPIIVGPFQGKPAVAIIAPTRGVCGEAYTKQKFVAVPDVHVHPDHIACDSASNSELVVPLFVNGQVVGVLDIDSKVLNHFTEENGQIFQTIMNEVCELAFKKYGFGYFEQKVVLSEEQFNTIKDGEIIGCSAHKAH